MAFCTYCITLTFYNIILSKFNQSFTFINMTIKMSVNSWWFRKIFEKQKQRTMTVSGNQLIGLGVLKLYLKSKRNAKLIINSLLSSNVNWHPSYKASLSRFILFYVDILFKNIILVFTVIVRITIGWLEKYWVLVLLLGDKSLRLSADEIERKS